MSRLITITLGFAPSRIWAQSLRAHFCTKSLQTEHFFIDQHYPIDETMNRQRLRELCHTYGVKVLDPGENLGLAKGFNWALQQIGVKDEDIVIAYDPDVHPLTPGWDSALVDVLRWKDDVVWASVCSDQMEADILSKPHRQHKIARHDVLQVRAPVMNSICAWKGKFLNAAGGLSEPNAFYGGLECSMWNILEKNDWKWVFLRNFREDPAIHWQQDDQYRKYKWEHAHLQKWKGDFKSFLEAGCPLTEEVPPAFGRGSGS